MFSVTLHDSCDQSLLLTSYKRTMLELKGNTAILLLIEMTLKLLDRFSIEHFGGNLSKTYLSLTTES